MFNFIKTFIGESSPYSLGKKSEKIAAKFLQKKGCSILARNFKTKFGEIDLIVQKKDMIIICEVKYRKDEDLLPYAISKKQQKRIFNACRCFISNNPKFNDFFIRFDALFLNHKFKVDHIENAWNYD